MKVSNINPIFFEKTKDGDQIWDIPSRLVKDRIIFLNGEITSENASNLSALLFLLNRESSDKLISLWIDSPGGDAQGFFAIYDMMQRIECPIRTICTGQASSAAAILLAAGTPGQRYAAPHSRIMIHQIQADGIGGSGTEVEIETKEIKKIKKEITETLARHTGQTVAKIKRDTVHDRYMSANDAIAYGIIDKVFGPKKQLPELKTKKDSNSIPPPPVEIEEDDEI